jgi:1,4-dihydroxy-2-naphthoyl-CoA hydrolase
MSDNIDNIKERFGARSTANDQLGIQLISATPDEVVLQVEVGPKVHQPFGILHGGVSALMAEGAASLGGALNVGPGQSVVGTELNCSHLRAMSSGTLTATALPIRKGRTVQVWGIELRDENERLICVARCTLQVITTPATA